MYSSLTHLQTAIRTALEKGPVFRVYKESLDACWPNLTDASQWERVEQFATQNRWSVDCRRLGNLGVVAEFRKGSSPFRE